MIVSKMQKQAKPHIAVSPRPSISTAAILPNTLPSQATTRIRERAYELYEVGGRKTGHDEQDWLQAEQEILKQRA